MRLKGTLIALASSGGLETSNALKKHSMRRTTGEECSAEPRIQACRDKSALRRKTSRGEAQGSRPKAQGPRPKAQNTAVSSCPSGPGASTWTGETLKSNLLTDAIPLFRSPIFLLHPPS